MLTIPARTDLPDYQMEIALDGLTYSLRLRWNTREQAWYLTLLDETDDPIQDFCNVKVVVNAPIGSRSVDPRRPPGFFVAMDSTNLHTDPGFTDLGDRVQLYYLEASDTLA